MKEEAATAVEQLHEAESEAKSLRTMTQRMILTKEEMVSRFGSKLDLLLFSFSNSASFHSFRKKWS